MNILQYEAITKTLECGTISKAAEALGYTQSGLSRMIFNLEEEMGTRIIERDRNGVRLTPEGEILMPYIRNVISAQRNLDQAVGKIKGRQLGLIRVGTFNSASAQWLPGMIKEFTDTYPDVRFELIHGTDEETRKLTEDGRVDMTFTDYSNRGNVLIEEFLMRDPIVCIFSSKDPKASLNSISLKTLEELPYVALNEGVDDEITRILTINNVNLDPRFIESDDHAVVAMVEQGLGTSLMSEMMLQGFEADIATVPLDPPAYRKIGLAYRDNYSLAAAAFMSHIRNWIRSHYPEDNLIEE